MRANSIGLWGAFCLSLFSACGNSSTSDPLCDSAELKVTCTHSNGQCVEYSGLSTSDEQANTAGCDTTGAPCPTAGREGTCNIPPSTPRSGVKCSPKAVINIRYFAPFDPSNAQTLCQGLPGATWTPN